MRPAVIPAMTVAAAFASLASVVFLACQSIAWQPTAESQDPRPVPAPAPAPAPAPTPADEPAPAGFDVPGAILLLRAQALDTDPKYAAKAMARLAEESLDRVTVELLLAVARGRDEVRRAAAAEALVTIGERAAAARHRRLAGRIGEHLYLSALPAAVRERAYPLFMLLDNESSRRHRR